MNERGTPHSKGDDSSETCTCADCMRFKRTYPHTKEVDSRLGDKWKGLAENDGRPGREALTSNTLPFTRVRRIIKANPDVNMLRYETPFLLTKASAYLIEELTTRSWENALLYGRRVVTKADVRAAAMSSEKFDFLMDVFDGTIERERTSGNDPAQSQEPPGPKESPEAREDPRSEKLD